MRRRLPEKREVSGVSTCQRFEGFSEFPLGDFRRDSGADHLHERRPEFEKRYGDMERTRRVRRSTWLDGGGCWRRKVLAAEESRDL
ncbi:ABC transporter family protein [Gossypium australe]|uniref:ABC transporter family protein n=1 Tax=Gossypium australe TaxID=47621 RepID=A0A5B6V9C4_9ROSI|nr:ABC transporter family protein [Gossypium australe]